MSHRPYNYSRHINEILYKSKSINAQELIKGDPQLFEEVRKLKNTRTLARLMVAMYSIILDFAIR